MLRGSRGEFGEIVVHEEQRLTLSPASFLCQNCTSPAWQRCLRDAQRTGGDRALWHPRISQQVLDTGVRMDGREQGKEPLQSLGGETSAPREEKKTGGDI